MLTSEGVPHISWIYGPSTQSEMEMYSPNTDRNVDATHGYREQRFEDLLGVARLMGLCGGKVGT